MDRQIVYTSDDIPLTIHLFTPEKSIDKLVIINSATGVRQQIYFGIAQFLANQGYTVITYDYRGIGLSKPPVMRGFKASMRTWGTLDYSAITSYAKKQYPSYKKYLIGHSVGALIMGMNKDAMDVEKCVFIATQKAYIGHLKQKIKWTAYLGFGIFQPLLTRIMGYFPAQWVGLGESLPRMVAMDWRTLILNPKSTNRLYEQLSETYEHQLHQKVLVISAEDDEWITPEGINGLLKDTYPNLQPHFRHLLKKESPKNEIGHINYFRSYNAVLWQIILNYFNQ